MRAEPLIYIFSAFSHFTFFFIFYQKVDGKKVLFFNFLIMEIYKICDYIYKDPSISYYIIMWAVPFAG